MVIEWLGNSSFFIKTSLGKRILIDPFNPLNTFFCTITSNIITVSKNFNKDLTINAPTDNVKIISSNSSFRDDHITIKGYASYSDKLKGVKRGLNYIYTYEFDKFKLCHLGYLGEFPNDELIKNLKGMDFVFIPIGGSICLNGSDANKLINELNPKYIIPMCYKSNNSDFYFSGPKDFICNSKSIYRSHSSIIDTLTLPSINTTPLTILLNG